MQNLQVPETAESRIVPKWLFPPRFPNKDRFTSSRPDFVLVTPIAAKTQKQQTNVGGWVLRSGRGQLRETGSISAAPPATSTATNPRQHRPKDLNKTRRDIQLVEIKYCEDSSLCLGKYDCAKPSMAERTWEDQPSGYLELNHMSACKTFLIMSYLKSTIHIYKVTAHAGILGNECADAIAKCSAKNQWP